VRQNRWPLALGPVISEALTNADNSSPPTAVIRTASGNTATTVDWMRSTPARALHTGQLVVERFAVHKIDKLDYIPQNTVIVESNFWPCVA
jgi:hypothetical protein